MLEFCPTCGNMLQLDPAQASRRLRLFCPTCPYIYYIDHKITRPERLVRKEADPIFSGSAAMKNAPKTQATCPSCGFGEAYFKQMQIRSADEPMTTFYMCCNDSCRKDWRED